MFSNKEIEEYYDHTYTNYKQHWKAEEVSALHYGFWWKETKQFSEALLNTNQHIIDLTKIDENFNILDAGCGVGGTLNYIVNKTNCKGVGITLSNKQVEKATKRSINANTQNNALFFVMDFTATKFEDNSFDVVYAVESMCHATEKNDFLNEAFRVLKPNGKLIVIDFFANDKYLQHTNAQLLLAKWLNLWAIKNIDGFDIFKNKAAEKFEIISANKYNNEVARSAKRLYHLSILGALPTWLYVTFNKATAFSKTHYLSGIYQYKAFKKHYWDYGVFCLQKK